jgi:hypothetical protein
MNFRPLVPLLAALALAGCESISNKIAAREAPEMRNFAANPRATYDAVRTSATAMGYRFVRGGAAQGELEAISGVGTGETIGSARQISMKVTLSPKLDGTATEVSIRLTEILEADSSNRAGQATETPLRDTPQYDVFFRRVGQALGVPPTPAR